MPGDERVWQRVRNESSRYKAEGEELVTRVYPFGRKELARWVVVPPVTMRARIVADTHAAVGHCGTKKLAEALLQDWWWPKLRRLVAQICAACPMCQVERLPPERWLHPLQAVRPTGPFLGWSIDLMVLPPDDQGHRYLAVAVDMFSKWVEATPICDKRAFTTATWLYDEIVARWGRPLYIRCDRGGEWEAEFLAAVKRMGIVRRQGASGNKRVNGLVERAIRTLRSILRKYLAAHPEAYWTDVLPFALIVLRHTAQRAHGLPPFTIVTGRIPILPSSLPGDLPPDLPEDATEAEEEAYATTLFEMVEALRTATGQRLSSNDRLIQAALKRKDQRGVHMDTVFHFQTGDLVLRKTR